MDSLALAHNFEAYQQESDRQQYEANREANELADIVLINQGRIEFAEAMQSVAKFGFWMATTGGVVFICRVLPLFSFGGMFVKAITFLVLVKGSIFENTDTKREGYQKILTAVSLGQIGAEWDSILAVGLAVNDFITLYGIPILVGALLLIVGCIFGIIKQSANSASTEGANDYDEQY